MNIHSDPLSNSLHRNGRDRVHSDDPRTHWAQNWDPLLVAVDPLDAEQLWLDLEQQLVRSQLMSSWLIEADLWLDLEQLLVHSQLMSSWMIEADL